jgi:hypothetical protein
MFQLFAALSWMSWTVFAWLEHTSLQLTRDSSIGVVSVWCLI